jgi:hypothetical protein
MLKRRVLKHRLSPYLRFDEQSVSGERVGVGKPL